MKLPIRLARRKARGFHTAFATSFAVEFAAFEQIMLPQLMASGATNILLIADERMSAHSLSDGSELPMQLGRDYVLYGPPATSGLFHPKIVLQLGRESGRVFVSSANVTAAGLGGNVELATEIECSSEASPERDFIQAVWTYLERITEGAEGAARDAIAWAYERTPWLGGPAPKPLLTLADKSLLSFLAVPAEVGVLESFSELVAGSSVERLVILSPYWNDELDTIADLQLALSPKRITVLLDAQRHDFPRNAKRAANLEIIDISGWRKSRFTHAKLLVALTAGHDHVISGSANCTSAALGRAGYRGANAEACVYRRLPAGAAIETLALAEVLALAPTPASLLPNVEHRKPIPLKSIADRSPGRFEVDHETLFWMPPETPDWVGAEIKLLAVDGLCVISVGAEKLIAREERQVVPCEGAELTKIYFAQVVVGETVSTIAPVMHRFLMKRRRREPASGRVARSAALFADGADLELFYLEAFEDLYRADSDETVAQPKIGVSRGSSKREEPSPSQARKLSYDEFMSERAAHPVSRRKGDNALAGTHCNSVRALLNRLSGGGEVDPHQSDDHSWMDMEEESQLVDNDREDVGSKPTGSDEVRERRADGKAFERAINNYIDGLKKEELPLRAADVVKLRLLLMTVLWNATCTVFPAGLSCSTSDQGWPRLAIRIIAAFFWGKNSPIRRLVLEGDFESLPVDFLECWATVLWTLDAIPKVLQPSNSYKEFLSRIPMLRAQIITQLRITEADLRDETIAKRRSGMDREIGRRLGLVPPDAHKTSQAA
jgi:hypothetical protein